MREVVRVADRGQQLTIDFRDGDRLTLTPPENLSLTINNRPTLARDLRPGDELRFYIPQDQLAATFFAGQPETAPVQTCRSRQPCVINRSSRRISRRRPGHCRGRRACYR